MALPLGTWGGTKFAIGWLPFGGYVEIAGMVDESTDADAVKREEAEVPADQLFKNKPAWQRLLVMVGRCVGQFLGGALYLCHDPLDVGANSARR